MITRLTRSANATHRQGRPPLLVTLATLWLLAVTAILSNTAQAAESILVFEDPTGQRTYDEVLANPQWFEQTSDTSRGISDSTYWIKLRVNNHSSAPTTRVVQFDSLRLPLVEEYLLTDSGMRLRSNGFEVPRALRPSALLKTSFPIKLDASTSVDALYSIKSNFKIDLDYQIAEVDQNFRSDQGVLIQGLLIFGGLVVLMLYNLFIAIMCGGRIYSAYSGILFSAAIATSASYRLYELTGISADSVAIEVYAGIALYGFSFLFLSLMFEANTKATKRLLLFGYIILAAHLTLEPSVAFQSFSTWAGPVLALIISYLIINPLLQKHPLAKYVLLGWLVFLAGSLAYVANLNGWLGVEFEHIMSLVNMFEAIVLSGVLAYRLRDMDRTEALLKDAQVELQRERLANEIGYSCKWEFDLERQLIRPDATLASWHEFGWQAGEWYPVQELFSVIPEEYRGSLQEDMRRGNETLMQDPESLTQLHHPMIRQDTGETIWVQVFGKLMEVDGRKLLIGTALDVTQLVHANQAVESEVEKFERLSEQAELSIWRLDLATNVVTYNLTFAKRWSLEPGATIQFSDFANLMTPQIVKIFEESVDQVISTREPLERTIQALTPHLRGGWHRLQFWPVLNEQGELIAIDLINANITPLMQTQAELQSTLTKQKELFAIVGHELRTPVSTIKMLAEDKELSAQERTQQIGDISESLLHVLEDMRVVISPERALESKTAPDNPFEVVSRSLNSVKSIVNENGLSLTRHMMQGAYATYLIYGQALRQIVTNLVKNAAIHSGGTQILVSMEVTYLKQQARARLRVEDDGKGIPVEQLETLYEAFARGDTSKDGSGLGLYIVKQLADRLQGSIAYTKSPLGGSCFTLNFPLGAEVAPSSKKLSEVSEVTLDGLRVLLAEDDNTLRMLTERMLIKRGAIVTSCINGREALDIFDPERFDLVVTDLMMPEMDGHQLTKEIRATGATTRIVAVTAAVIGQETEQFMEAGADAVLSKPLRPDALVEALAKIEAEGLV